MIKIKSGSVSDDYTNHESSYQTQYSIWNGLVSRNPVLRQIVDIRAASVFSSWVIKGSHEKQATAMLENMRGRNNESFKQILANMYRIAYICGDAYAEKIYQDNDSEKPLEDLHILPSDNIRQITERGRIKRYEEVDGEGNWKVTDGKSRIFHVRYNPRGATTHGIGMVEALNNVLVSREQLMQVGQDIYEKMSQPKQVILAKTSNEAQLQLIRNAIKDAGDTWHGVAVLPATLIDSTKEITLNPSLKPQEYLDYLDKEIFKATATPEIVLGTGYSTSEEDAKTRIAGFMGSIRYDQEMFEDMVYKQILEEEWPTSTPEIEFAFTQEAYDAMYNRIQSSLPVIESLTSVAPENKELIIKEKLKDMGLIT